MCLGEDPHVLNAVGQGLIGPQRRSSIFMRQTSNGGSEGGVSEVKAFQQYKLNYKVQLKKPLNKVAVPLWIFHPKETFASVRQLLLCQRCCMCVVWLDGKLSDDTNIETATR